MLSRSLVPFLTALALLISTHALAEDYVIDAKGQHASIHFRINHLGYSWLIGRFNKLEGTFSFDENDINATKVNVSIDPASIDSNHAERDKRLKGEGFLDVSKFKIARFVSTSVRPTGEGKAILTGDLTLHGVTKSIEIKVNHVGAGKDRWGGFRRGFEGTTTLALKDFNINYNLGPASTHVQLRLNIEGVRKG